MASSGGLRKKSVAAGNDCSKGRKVVEDRYNAGDFVLSFTCSVVGAASFSSKQ
ncbi:unnamed protein product [Cuscuta europaea]|uniref:Uncharacterized protein n=1 Tax=Cuscuta europaea TaxID=41803 RepID=A0A9P1EJL3_CUSEU|nr:unnamed protein product [Cuscuta europaea]